MSSFVMAFAGPVEGIVKVVLLILTGGLLIIGAVAAGGMLVPSRRLATTALVLLALLTFLLRPWICFEPFGPNPSLHAEMGVEGLIAVSKIVGIGWIVTGGFVPVAWVYALFKDRNAERAHPRRRSWKRWRLRDFFRR